MSGHRGERPDSAGQPQAGTHIDQYRVEHPLGRGGFGEVFLARDVQLGRRVALKVLRPERFGSAANVQAFLDEARTTARFSHPHIVAIHGVGEWEGRPYVALEYLEGQSLRERLREGRPGIREAVRVALPIAEALAEAHRRGVLHRDLKPGNVMIPRDGRVRVVDFGEARPIEEARSEGRGTPAYMAPERWRGASEGPAADLWSLGVVLREMLVGSRPYDGLPPSVLAVQAATDDPVPPLADGAGVPPVLAALIGRCLDKTPLGRPTAEEAAEILRTFLVGDSSGAAAAPSAAERPYRGLMPFAERHADRFFGREAELDAFQERLRRGPVIPLVGPSGVGKSSFVRAGVIPRLREQGPWKVVRMRPGRQPFASLSLALLRARTDAGPLSRSTAPSATMGETPPPAPADDDPAGRAALAAELREAPGRLWLRLHELADEAGARLLLLVDQLEELFTHTRSTDERRRFLRALCTATDDPASPVRVVLALRDDFMVPFAAGPGAQEALRHVFVLRAPGSPALREAVLRPLEAVDYRFEDETQADEMVRDLAGAPGCLPALQAACEQLWEARDAGKRWIPREALEELGGVSGALARHADGALTSLLPEQLAVARALLLRLVTPERTRKIVTRTALLDGIGDGETVLDALIRGRIVHAGRSTGADDADGTLELVHESLIGGWDQLVRWMDEARDELAFLEDVGQAAEVWERRGQRDEELWSGEPLIEAWSMVEGLAVPPPTPVLKFLSRARDLGRKERSRRRSRAVYQLGLLVVVALLSAVTAIVLGGRIRASLAASTLCANADEHLTDVWDETARDAARERFGASDRPHAVATYERLATLLDGYAQEWRVMREESCLATHARGDQSAELHDLRVACLDRRLGELAALSEALVGPLDEPVVDEALAAAYGLTPVEVCADVAALTAAVPPPEDPAVRREIAELRPRLDSAVIRFRLGEYTSAAEEARELVSAAEAVGYAPFHAEVIHWLGRATSRAGDPGAAEEHLVLSIETAAAGRDDRLAAESWIALMDVVGNDQGRVHDASLLGQLAEAQVHRAGEDPYLRVRFLGVLGQIQTEMDQREEARASFDEAYRILQEQLGTDHPDVAVALEGLGWLAISDADFEEAESLFQRALDVRRRALGEAHPEVWVSLKGLSKARFRQGRYEEARAAVDEGLELLRAALGPGHPDVGVALGQVGPIQRSQGDYEAAEATYLAALAILENAHGTNPGDLAALLNNLGTLHAYTREDEEARVYFFRALEIVESVYGADHTRASRVLGNLGTTYARQGRHDEAEDYYRRMLAIRERAYGPDHYDTAYALMYLGASYVNTRQYAEAVAQYERCVPIIEGILGGEHQITGYALNGYGEALAGVGRHDEAVEILERVLALRLAINEDPVQTATTRFALGRALTGLGSGDERIGPLLDRARAAYAADGEPSAIHLSELEDWAREHGR